MGGLPRRATTVDAERARGPVFVVDGGSLFAKSPSVDPLLLGQAREKARVIAAAYARSGVDAMLPAAADLALGVEFVSALAQEHRLPYVASNLECDGGAPFPPARTATAGGVTLRVVGLVGEEHRAPGCRVTDPGAALSRALAGAGEDLVLLLADRPSAEVDALVQAVPGVDLVIGTDRRLLQNPAALPNGGLRLGAGSRGKEVGVFRFELTPGAERWADEASTARLAQQKDRYAERLAKERAAVATDPGDARATRQVEFLEKRIAEVEGELAASAAARSGPAHRGTHTLVGLDASVPDHPEVAAMLAAARDAINAAAPTAVAAAQGPFAGSATCLGCHPAEAAQWQATPHATAWNTLVAQNRAGDQSCFGCHATGAFHPEGPQVPAAVGILTSVGCEACHGPGREHVARPKEVDLIRDPGPQGCTTCHDGVKDEGRFDYATYRPKVVHP